MIAASSHTRPSIRTLFDFAKPIDASTARSQNEKIHSPIEITNARAPQYISFIAGLHGPSVSVRGHDLRPITLRALSSHSWPNTAAMKERNPITDPSQKYVTAVPRCGALGDVQQHGPMQAWQDRVMAGSNANTPMTDPPMMIMIPSFLCSQIRGTNGSLFIEQPVPIAMMNKPTRSVSKRTTNQTLRGLRANVNPRKITPTYSDVGPLHDNRTPR